VECVVNEGSSSVDKNIWEKKAKSGGLFGSIGSFFSNVFGSIGSAFKGILNMFGLGGLFKYFKYIVPILCIGLFACVFFNCGGPLLLKQCLRKRALPGL